MNQQEDNKIETSMNSKNAHLASDATFLESKVEDQIAINIIELLDNRAQHLSLAEAQRLDKARNIAVDLLAIQQSQTAGINQSGHVLQWFGNHVGLHRRISVMVFFVAVLLAVFAIQHFGFNNSLENSDAFLLASDLPPEAYADKGFNTWLGSN